VVILWSLVGISTFVFFLDTIRRSLLEGPRIVVLAAEARGLIPGSDVWIAGSPAGRVTDVAFGDPAGPEGGRVVVHALLHRTAIPYLRAGAEARISSSSLLAPVVLKLTPGDPSSGPFDPVDTLSVPRNETTEEFVRLAGDSRVVMESLFFELEALRERLDEGPGTIASLRGDSVLLSRFRRLADQARTLSDAIGERDGLASLIAGDSVGPALGGLVSGFRTLAAGSQPTEVRDSVVELVSALERISVSLSTLDSDLRAGRGTAGRALNDDEIVRQQRLLRARLDSVRSELMWQPWRWLRFKLF
jgi:phospholipid/cholesterol/gamma-HCH transport system substrate-binding protein